MLLRRVARSGISTAFAALTAVVLLAGTATAAGLPGAPSIGDPYYPTDGNTGYHVFHYDLRLTYQPGADTLSGTATILATTTQELSSFSFDFGLDTSSVLVDNAPAMFHQQDDKLVITPPQDLPDQHKMTVVVRYSGIPSKIEINGEKDWVATADGALAVQEPHICAFWFPCNDHPLDKASYDVSVAVPDGTQVLAAGELTGQSSQLGWTRWNWRSEHPTATYLEFLTIGHYEIDQTIAPDGRPFITAYEQGLGPNLAAAKASVQRTPEVLAWESGMFGPYPFEAEGGVVPVTKIGFALENQTRPVYSPTFFDSGSAMYVIVHENAHQWYGDSVSVHHWQDIWLNEGFAGYTEWLWSEHEGEGSTQQLANYTYQSHPATDPYWQILPADPGAAHQFADPVYSRGAMTLQALRNVVGDTAFFAILRGWATQQRYGNGDTAQFVALAERVAGKPLAALFQTWLFTKGAPAQTPANGFPAPTGKPAAVPTVTQPKSYRAIELAYQAR